MLDVRHPFFRPLWRRIATVAFVAAWLGIEIAAGSLWWGLLAAGIGAYLVYEFFIAFDPEDYVKPGGGSTGG